MSLGRGDGNFKLINTTPAYDPLLLGQELMSGEATASGS